MSPPRTKRSIGIAQLHRLAKLDPGLWCRGKAEQIESNHDAKREEENDEADPVSLTPSMRFAIAFCHRPQSEIPLFRKTNLPYEGVRHLFSGPDVFVAHDLAFAVASPGADDRQLNVPPAASLRHDLTGTGPLKTGDRPIPRRGRVAITGQRPFGVPRCPDIPDDRQIFDWSPA